MILNVKETLLLMVDVQNDFLPSSNGALAVQGGDEVIAPLNVLSAAFSAKNGWVAVTQDWHPPEHVSFASSYDGKKPGEAINAETVEGQELWPDHCVQGKWGAAFHEKLDLNSVVAVFRKGFRKNLDSYSAFFENDWKTSTGLEGWIRSLGINKVVIGGLALDYCVFYSAIDCIGLGFTTIVASDATRGVGIPAGSVDKAVNIMKESGVIFATSAQIIDWLK